MPHTILRVDSSANLTSSKTRDLTEEIISRLSATQVITRDLDAVALPQISEAWAEARLVPAQDRTTSEKDTLALSDELIAELRAAETIIIGAPLYNFTIPASLKLWIDLIARPKETFAYTDNGPKGLLENKRAYIAMASGGVPIGAPMDFASPYLKHFLGFVGITDVTFVTPASLPDFLKNTVKIAAQ